MNFAILQNKINSLSPLMIRELNEYVDSLLKKNDDKSEIKDREFGCCKGMFVISDGFDEPLDDFKDYM